MLGIRAAAEIDVLDGRQRRRVLGAQRPLRHGARSHRRPARPRGARRGDAALDRASARRRCRDRAAHRAARCVVTWYVGLDAEARGSATRCGTARSSTTATQRARGRAVPPDLPRSARSSMDAVRGRAGLSDPGDDAGDKLLRMKPQNLVTGLPVRPSGGGDMSRAAPAHAHPRRRRGRAAQGAEPVDRFHLAAGRGAAGRAGRAALDGAARRGERSDVLCRRAPRSSSIAPRRRNYRDNLATGAPPLWVVLRPTGAIRRTRSSPSRPIRPRAKASPRPATISSSGADAGVDSQTVAAFVAEHHVEQQFVKRKRDRADPEALARRGCAIRRRQMSEPEDFLARWSRRKREAARTAEPPSRRRRDARAMCARPKRCGLLRRRRRADAVRSRQPAADRIDHAPRPTSGLPARRACRPNSTRAALRRAWSPIPRSATSSASPRMPGTSTIRTRCRASGRSN